MRTEPRKEGQARHCRHQDFQKEKKPPPVATGEDWIGYGGRAETAIPERRAKKKQEQKKQEMRETNPPHPSPLPPQQRQ